MTEMIEIYESNVEKCTEFMAEIDVKIAKLHKEKMKYLEKKLINLKEAKAWKKK